MQGDLIRKTMKMKSQILTFEITAMQRFSTQGPLLKRILQMTYTVTQSFKRKGLPQVVGATIELTIEQADKLRGFVAPLPESNPQSEDGVIKFESEGDPVSCPYWYQVCWSCKTYQQHCSRDSNCLTYKFLKRQDATASQDEIDVRKQSAEANRRRLAGGSR